jgi:hypothetical protein
VASTGQIHLREIRRMLNDCAPDHSWVEKDHRIHVGYNGKWFRNLPTGAHSDKGHIQRPWVKKLARQLEIWECANRVLNLG